MSEIQAHVCIEHASHISRVCLSVSFHTDIDHIWSLVSCFIKQQMFMRKGVYIFGLGTFTFCQQKLNLGNKHILIQRPVFILAEKLSHYYGFKQIKPQATDVPVGPLNFSALSAEGPFQRDTVERCVRETLHLLLRAAATRPSVSHAFPGIGVLTFRQSRVKMLFCRDFISALDGTGKLSSASRPESRNSRESERSCNVPRPATFSGATLPRISAGEALRKQLQTDEDDDDGGWDECSISRTNLRLSLCHEHRGVSLSIATVKSSAADASLDRACRDHRRAGQELCYVCMQRAQRNLPLFQSDESRAEREQERVLMLQEHQKDLQYFQKEEVPEHTHILNTDRRCSEISPHFDARPMFGLMDSNPAALAEQRWRTQNISEELMNTANQRRRETLEKLGWFEWNECLFRRMLDERIRRYEKLRLLRAACEESWHRSADLKHQRDREELNSRRFGGQTLTEQLGKYERCSQCKRSTANRGESNVFRDTDYVTGARLML
uniref:CCDC81 HU domain-containing protein n=1 Tax=Sinocyclocheilus grahami TaxID=75366 RepID=A0A672KZX5_SINGR